MRFRNWPRGVTALITVMVLGGCTVDHIAAQQEIATGLWDELVAGESYGQSFVCTHDNLYRIDLGTATFARANTAPVVFHLLGGPQAGTEIATVTIPGPEIQNERPTSILFSPLADSLGERFYFHIDSPEATRGNAITVYTNATDQYPDGTAFRNGHPVDGDLVFAAYSLETFTIGSVLADFASRMAQDIPFFACYGALLLLVSALLALSLARPRSSGPQHGDERGA